MKKPIMKIGMVGRASTYNGKFGVNWGSTSSAYNRQVRYFNTRKQAIVFKNQLIRKFKPKYTVEYMYIAN